MLLITDFDIRKKDLHNITKIQLQYFNNNKISKRNSCTLKGTFNPVASLWQTKHQHLQELNIAMGGSAKYLPLDSYLPGIPNLQHTSMVSTDFINSESSTRALCHWLTQIKKKTLFDLHPMFIWNFLQKEIWALFTTW